jgi:cation:H+ antiporter
MDLVIAIGLGVFASWMISRACNGFETAADYLGRNMREGTKGATINAVGSSMPELCVTFIYLFVYANTTGFAGGIGTTAGSAVFNAMVIPSLVIFYVLWRNKNATITVSRRVVIRDGLTLLAVELFLIYFIGYTLSWYHGFILMMLYVVYAGMMIFRHTSKDNDSVADNKDENEADVGEVKDSRGSCLTALLKIDLENVIIRGKALCTQNATVLIILATVYIVVACWLLVYSCEEIGEFLGIHGYFVAVIIAAAASSVPDTILSVKDAGKGNYDDAIANALGSNIFDICFALGAPLFLFTILYGSIDIAPETASHIMELRVLLFLLTLVVFIIFLCSKKFTKSTAYMLMSMYLMFVMYVAARAAEIPFANTIGEYLIALQNLLR